MMVPSRYPIDTPAFDLQSMTQIAKCNVQYSIEYTKVFENECSKTKTYILNLFYVLVLGVI